MELRKRKANRLKDYDYNQPGAYFVTVCTKDRKCLLSKIVGTGVPDGPKSVLKKHGIIADKHIKNMSNFYEDISIERYVIMPNHIHLLILITENFAPLGPSRTPVPTTRQNSKISRFISTFKRFCNKEYKENIWQMRSHDHIIRNKNDYEKIAKYIYENPLVWHYDCFFTEDT